MAPDEAVPCRVRAFLPQIKLLDRTVRLEGSAPPRRSYRLLPAPLPAAARRALRRAGTAAGSARRRPAGAAKAEKPAKAAPVVPGFDPRDPMLGRTVWRFWPDDGGWFRGVVRAHDARSREWKVVYDEVREAQQLFSSGDWPLSLSLLDGCA